MTEDGPLRGDVPSDVVGASDQFLVQAWVVALHAHKVQPDGVQNPSRLNEERSIACYDRALDKLY